MFSDKAPMELSGHAHLRLSSYDPIHAKIFSTFLKFDFKSMYMPRFNLSDELLDQITVPMSAETEPITDDICPWSGEHSDKFCVK